MRCNCVFTTEPCIFGVFICDEHVVIVTTAATTIINTERGDNNRKNASFIVYVYHANGDAMGLNDNACHRSNYFQCTSLWAGALEFFKQSDVCIWLPIKPHEIRAFRSVYACMCVFVCDEMRSEWFYTKLLSTTPFHPNTSIFGQI